MVDSHGNALLKTLVKPRGDVIDLRTDITGITSEQLATVTTTCHDVRRQVHTGLGPKSNSFVPSQQICLSPYEWMSGNTRWPLSPVSSTESSYFKQ